MKKIYLLLILQSLIFNLQSAFGQGGTWTWISGDSAGSSSGVFGTQGIPSVNNHPPGMYEPCEWKDKQGNFWIYGGSYPDNNDLWKFNPATKEWTWVKGDGLANQLPVYGAQGVSNISNSPGCRQWTAATWVDTSGGLWLFGGNGDSVQTVLYNDLWKYDIGINEWTWMKGAAYPNAAGVHGTQGIPSPSNNPGARMETSSAWTDSLNNLWLYGGQGYGENANFTYLGDLCKYDIATNEWTWMKGSKIGLLYANYGVKQVTAASNDPGSRFTYNKWKDLQGNFWLMGGLIYGTRSSGGLNDVWKYDLSVNNWTWMAGTNIKNDSGIYNTTCLFDTVNMPCARMEQRSSVTDNCGRFWLYGGFNQQSGTYNDLWVFDPQQLKWNWLSGTNLSSSPGNYGNLGISSPSNIPPSRGGAVAWWGNDDSFYLFGGSRDGNTDYQYSDVWVFNADANCVASCNSLASFQSGNTTICAYDCINFTNLSANATSWQWTFAGAIDSTSTAQNPLNICYTTVGTYNVTLVASNAGGSDSVTLNNYIHVKATPPTPVIIQHHDTLYCTTDTSYTSYQWYMDSTIIHGATDTLIIVSQNGNYNLRVTNSNGCNIAVGITVIIGIQNYTNNNTITLSPNPASDQLSISGNWKEGGNMKLTILNTLGQIIYTKEINRKQETVNCKLFPSGIYFIQVANEAARWVGRFIKE